MTDAAIEIEGLGKKYRIFHQDGPRIDTFSERLVRPPGTIAKRLLRRAGDGQAVAGYSEFWALRDFSFRIEPGDRVGIIGRNGAGKTTLLKLLSRITEPTAGQFTLRGRVASLLEVGTGFHPELTGAENILLNGAVLGMTRAEIRRRFDAIVAFAEVEEFLDTPVKRYSSGMYVRLAFSVAAHLEPEILIVDEVLAVGDARFQKKCVGKMDDAAREGRTILLVSHNMMTVEGLCNRAIWLDKGRTMASGAPGDVVTQYLGTSFSSCTEQTWEEDEAPSTREMKLRRAAVRPLDGSPCDPIRIVEPFVMEFEVFKYEPEGLLNMSVRLYNEYGVLVFETAPVEITRWLDREAPVGLFRYRCHIPGNLLNAGMHRVVLTVSKKEDLILHVEKDILVFELVDSVENRAGWFGHWEGAVRPILDWDIEVVDESSGNTTRVGE